MTEREYMAASALQRLRAALSLVVDSTPVGGIPGMTDRQAEAVGAIASMIGHLEYEVQVMMDGEEEGA